MVVDERSRHQLYRRLEEVLGTEAATTLIEHLPPVGWADVATKHDLAGLEERIELRFARVDDRFNMMEERFTGLEERLEERFTAVEERSELRFARVDVRSTAWTTASRRPLPTSEPPSSTSSGRRPPP